MTAPNPALAEAVARVRESAETGKALFADTEGGGFVRFGSRYRDDLRAFLSALDRAVEVVRPLAELSKVPPILVGRGENTHRREPLDDEAFHHGRLIKWGMLRQAAAFLDSIEPGGGGK